MKRNSRRLSFHEIVYFPIGKRYFGDRVRRECSGRSREKKKTIPNVLIAPGEKPACEREDVFLPKKEPFLAQWIPEFGIKFGIKFRMQFRIQFWMQCAMQFAMHDVICDAICAAIFAAICDAICEVICDAIWDAICDAI